MSTLVYQADMLPIAPSVAASPDPPLWSVIVPAPLTTANDDAVPCVTHPGPWSGAPHESVSDRVNVSGATCRPRTSGDSPSSMHSRISRLTAGSPSHPPIARCVLVVNPGGTSAANSYAATCPHRSPAAEMPTCVARPTAVGADAPLT